MKTATRTMILVSVATIGVMGLAPASARAQGYGGYGGGYIGGPNLSIGIGFAPPISYGYGGGYAPSYGFAPPISYGYGGGYAPSYGGYGGGYGVDVPPPIFRSAAVVFCGRCGRHHAHHSPCGGFGGGYGGGHHGNHHGGHHGPNRW